MIQTTIRTAITGRVGYAGEKVHRVAVIVDGNGRDGAIRTMVDAPYCGSKRHGSGWAVLPFGTPITCEKCAKRPLATDYEYHYDAASYADGSSSPERRTLGFADYSKVVRVERGTIVATDFAIETIEADRAA